MFAGRTIAAGALVVAVLAATLVAQAPAPPARVSIPVAVTRAGLAVPGLTGADFTLRDSGVVQRIELVAAESLPVNLLLALDCSASLRGAAMEAMKEAARAAFKGLRPGDQGALLTFSQNVNLRSGWTGDQAVLAKAVDSMSVQGSTSLSDAVFAALALRSRPGSRTLIVFVTDGDDIASWMSASDVVQAARRSEAVVSSVLMSAPGHTGAILGKAFAARGDKSSVDGRAQITQWLHDDAGLYRTALLPVLAVDTGGETEQIADTASLSKALTDIVSRDARRYVLQYVPAGVPAAGWHPIEVEVKGGGEINARRGYAR